MMRKKRLGRVSHDRWLVSYADFITLLFAFFVVLFATEESDKTKKVELAASIQSAFNQMGIFGAHAKVLPKVNAAGGGGLAEDGMDMAVFEHKLGEVAGPEIASGVIGMHESESGLVVSLEEAGFFDSGIAEVRPSALPVLNRIAAVLPETGLRVEGHTDDVPIHTPQYASNWELSSARASSIARLLLVHSNVHAESLSVAGYAEFHPAASNDTAEGRARNRRVDIVVLRGNR